MFNCIAWSSRKQISNLKFIFRCPIIKFFFIWMNSKSASLFKTKIGKNVFSFNYAWFDYNFIIRWNLVNFKGTGKLSIKVNLMVVCPTTRPRWKENVIPACFKRESTTTRLKWGQNCNPISCSNRHLKNVTYKLSRLKRIPRITTYLYCIRVQI